LFWRALVAFLALPAMVGYLLPWLMRPKEVQPAVAGLAVLAAGTVLLFWCVRDFYVVGRGTLAPWSPPRHLVTVGLYRVSRNPMYLAVLTILCGWALAFHSVTLWEYAAIVAVGFHLRVVFFEEPWLALTFGDAFSAYRARVWRWLGWKNRLSACAAPASPRERSTTGR
jgi:protein-S-isoprenylcysteine O-methyltransferase Ste14